MEATLTSRKRTDAAQLKEDMRNRSNPTVASMFT